jgi:hypothetical protein
MDYSKASFLLRLMVKKMGAPEGDFRDWAADLRPALMGA